MRKYSPEDLLVINDGSTDESKEIVEEISSCTKLKGVPLPITQKTKDTVNF